MTKHCHDKKPSKQTKLIRWRRKKSIWSQLFVVSNKNKSPDRFVSLNDDDDTISFEAKAANAFFMQVL